jgi:hypothetical protein
MNELLASIVYVYFQEAYVPKRLPDGFETLSEEYPSPNPDPRPPTSCSTLSRRPNQTSSACSTK